MTSALKTSRHLRDFIYRSDTLRLNRPDNKVVDISSTDASFSHTTITDVEFRNCTFEDCLFIDTTFVDCEFHECTFKGCNPLRAQFVNTYIDPSVFEVWWTDHSIQI